MKLVIKLVYGFLVSGHCCLVCGDGLFQCKDLVLFGSYDCLVLVILVSKLLDRSVKLLDIDIEFVSFLIEFLELIISYCQKLVALLCLNIHLLQHIFLCLQ